MGLYLPLLVLSACGSPEPLVPETPPRPAAPPTLLLLTLDTTRADALGAYGAPASATPVLDRLAADGVRFARAFTHAPSTQSAHASLFTGLDPHGHGVPFNGRALDLGHETLAERLAQAGWTTQGVVAAAVLGRNLGMDQGFALYDDDFVADGPEDRAHDVTARALRAAQQAPPDQPLFLWVHYFDPHHPYEPADSAGGATADTMRAALGHKGLDTADLPALRALYAAEVLAMDTAIGTLLAGLAELGRLEEASIVVAGDHGEAFGEDPDRPFLHGPDVDPFATQVPLIVSGRGSLAPQPGVVAQAVALSEVPTLALGVLGLAPGLGPGRDLTPALGGAALVDVPILLEATKPRRELTDGGWNNLGNERGVIEGDWILMERTEAQQPPVLWRIGPPLAQVQDPTRHDALLQTLRAWDQAAPSAQGSTADEVKPALEALGYLEP